MLHDQQNIKDLDVSEHCERPNEHCCGDSWNWTNDP
jgi:hypothetical protein